MPENGKAFEYACVNAFFDELSITQKVHLVDNASFNNAKKQFEISNPYHQRQLILAAQASVRYIIRQEPYLLFGPSNAPLVFKLQDDRQGILGDVRDVLFIRRGADWEIGLSCKHNHNAVKHSRLSMTIDFGAEWFDYACSSTYFLEIAPVFDRLRKIKEDANITGETAYWMDIQDKAQTVYIPVLDAFMKELHSLNSRFSQEIPKLLVHYMLGKHDFYKVVCNINQRTTSITTMNINGTLGCPTQGHSPISGIPKLKLPTTFHSIDYKNNSSTTIEIVCDNGWQLSMRIHNASSMIEPSLKFDVNLISMPMTCPPILVPVRELVEI